MLLRQFAPVFRSSWRFVSTKGLALKLRRRRTLFFGNDGFSLIHLRTLNQVYLLETGVISSLCVVTSSKDTVVFDWAQENALKIVLWDDLEPQFVEKYDLGILASFGHLLPVWLLNTIKVINVHPSLLPRWRGSSPVLHTILRGDPVTGVSLMLLEAKQFDRGPLIMQETVTVPKDIRAKELTLELAQVGQRMLTRAFANLPKNVSHAVAQPTEGATSARKVTDADAVLDCSLSADQIHRLDRSVGDIIPLTSHFGDLPVSLRGFASPEQLQELCRAVALPPCPAPGTLFFNKHVPDVVFVRCRDWTAFRSILIGRSNAKRRWLTPRDFYNGYLKEFPLGEASLRSQQNPLFRRRSPPVRDDLISEFSSERNSLAENL